MELLPPQEKYRGYCEPFCGGATLYWAREFNKKCVDTLNDTNGAIINFFRVLRDPKQAMDLFRMLYFTPYSRDAHKEAKDLNAGRISEPIKGDIEKAWALMQSITQGFNSSTDTDWSSNMIPTGGSGTSTKQMQHANREERLLPEVENAWAWWNDVIMGYQNKSNDRFAYVKSDAASTQRYKASNNRKEETFPNVGEDAEKFLFQFFQPIHQLIEISKYTDRLKMVQLENLDALDCIKKYDTEHTLFYIDPPYPNANQGHYKGYTQNDLDELIFLLKDIKGSFLLSCYHNEYIDVYAKEYDWEVFEFDAVCSASKTTRDRRTEVVWRKLNEVMK